MKKNFFRNIQIYSIIIMLILLVFGLVVYTRYQENDLRINKSHIIVMSWIGYAELIYILFTSKAKNGKIISMYTIFMIFLFIFNYGQPMLWAFGIFTEDSIINSKLFNFAKPSMQSIFVTQLIILICGFVIHCGFLLGKSSKMKNQAKININTEKSFYFFLTLLIIVLPFTFYKLFKQYQVARIYGYRALYYGENINNFNSIISIMDYWFFPCIIGLLISSNYKMKKFVYVIFAIFILINLSIGERGTWLFKLFILAYAIIYDRKKKIPLKKMIIGVILGYTGLYFISAIKELRNVGISLATIQQTLNWDHNPIVEFITEMGCTMKTTIVLVEHGWDIYPYGNTYVFAIIAMISSKIIPLLGLNYVSVSSWFSQTYLHLNYGAGFSLITEALMNVGPYLLPIIMFIFGLILNKMLNSEENSRYDLLKNSIFLNAIIPIARNTMYYTLKEIFWGVIVFLMIYKMICGGEENKIENINTKNIG